ncbi:MAG: NAD(P)/FAD-dependent oxidoreductase [Pseudomonadota bacterium]
MDPDVIVIGAGAAGIGAGLELQSQGVPFVILEAANRVGGRAFTDRTSLPAHWDQGCHWLHCADQNPLVEWADRLGAVYDDQEWNDHFSFWADGKWLGRDDRLAANAALRNAFEAVYAVAGRGEDAPISGVLPDCGIWNRPVRYFLQLMACEDLEHVSALAYGDYDDTDLNWPVVSGYGDLLSRMAGELPVRLLTPVSAVEQSTSCVRLTTPDGTVEAKAAIVTASTNVLLSGSIEFSKGSVQEVLDLAQNVPCGAYEKVAIALRRWPEEVMGRTFFSVDPRDGSPPLDFQVAGTDQPLLIAHMAGSLARDLLREGRDAMAEFGADRLIQAFGSDIRQDIIGAHTTDWLDNPHVLGGYSYARAGYAKNRHDMIKADTGSVAFAGEAFSLSWQATAHGAYQSGRDVASRLIDTMKLAA